MFILKWSLADQEVVPRTGGTAAVFELLSLASIVILVLKILAHVGVPSMLAWELFRMSMVEAVVPAVARTA